MDNDAHIRCFLPLSHLPKPLQDKAVALAQIHDYGRGQVVYVQGQNDDFVHYLLSGTVQLIWQGRVSRNISATHKVALRPLDPPGSKRYTVRAAENATIVSFKRSLLDGLLNEYEAIARAAPLELEVSEIAATHSPDWMIRMLQSELFCVLPATNIQKIFARMEEIACKADEVVIQQGSEGDYYYVIEKGYCEVSRTIAAGRGQIHLADLGPGTAFGEEALISGKPRNASVTMLSDGLLMRLAKEDFVELIMKDVLKPLGFEAAAAEIAAGAVWLDVRYPEDHATQAFAQSENIPVNILRLQSNRLRRDFRYIICGNDPEQCSIAAFLLGERGFDVAYLNVPISEVAAARPDAVVGRRGELPQPTLISFPATQHSERGEADMDRDDDHDPLEDTITKISKLYTHAQAQREMSETTPVEKFADTATGRELAEIINELAEKHDELDDRPTEPEQRRSDFDGVSRVASESPPGEFDKRVRRLDPGAILQDSISAIMREVEDTVRQAVATAVASRTDVLAAEYRDKLARMRELTNQEIQQREARIRNSVASEYNEKEQLLRGYYKKVIALANNISRQKAQLQEARRQFEIKLTSANQLYREVEEMRQLLTENIGYLDQHALEEMPKLSLSL